MSLEDEVNRLRQAQTLTNQQTKDVSHQDTVDRQKLEWANFGTAYKQKLDIIHQYAASSGVYGLIEEARKMTNGTTEAVIYFSHNPSVGPQEYHRGNFGAFEESEYAQRAAHYAAGHEKFDAPGRPKYTGGTIFTKPPDITELSETLNVLWNIKKIGLKERSRPYAPQIAMCNYVSFVITSSGTIIISDKQNTFTPEVWMNNTSVLKQCVAAQIINPPTYHEPIATEPHR